MSFVSRTWHNCALWPSFVGTRSTPARMWYGVSKNVHKPIRENARGIIAACAAKITRPWPDHWSSRATFAAHDDHFIQHKESGQKTTCCNCTNIVNCHCSLSSTFVILVTPDIRTLMCGCGCSHPTTGFAFHQPHAHVVILHACSIGLDFVETRIVRSMNAIRNKSILIQRTR